MCFRFLRTLVILAILIGTITGWKLNASAEDKAPVKVLFTNVHVFDGENEKRIMNASVLIEDNLIKQVSTKKIEAKGATVIDGKGGTLMPGLIDNHWHAMFAALPLQTLLSARDGYINLAAAKQAEATLQRGFTTVRDVGGNPFSVKAAIDQGLYDGPRIFPSGPPIGQTSGHSDVRGPSDVPAEVDAPLHIAARNGHFLIADGVPAVLQRTREALRMGASQIKIMAGGGTQSAFDPIDSTQYTFEELKAAVDAAKDWNTYVTVHAYTPAAIQRSIRAGVQCIEHAQLIDEQTMKIVKEKDIWLSMQPFVTGEEWMYSPNPFTRAKQAIMFKGTEVAYQLARKHGVKLAFGTDILFAPAFAEKQGYMLTLLERWFTPYQALKMAGNTRQRTAPKTVGSA